MAQLRVRKSLSHSVKDSHSYCITVLTLANMLTIDKAENIVQFVFHLHRASVVHTVHVPSQPNVPDHVTFQVPIQISSHNNVPSVYSSIVANVTPRFLGQDGI